MKMGHGLFQLTTQTIALSGDSLFPVGFTECLGTWNLVRILKVLLQISVVSKIILKHQNNWKSLEEEYSKGSVWD